MRGIVLFLAVLFCLPLSAKKAVYVDPNHGEPITYNYDTKNVSKALLLKILELDYYKGAIKNEELEVILSREKFLNDFKKIAPKELYGAIDEYLFDISYYKPINQAIKKFRETLDSSALKNPIQKIDIKVLTKDVLTQIENAKTKKEKIELAEMQWKNKIVYNLPVNPFNNRHLLPIEVLKQKYKVDIQYQVVGDDIDY